MLRTLIIITVLICAFLSCGKEKSNIEDKGLEEYGLIIKMSDACGWCGGYDSLKISQSSAYYEFFGHCEDDGYTNYNETDDEDWNELITILNLQEFKNIDVNTCYVCVDGCDTWISVKTENYYHEIRFADLDSLKVQPIQSFIDKLKEIKSHLTVK